MPARRLTFYLLRDGLLDFDEALDQEKTSNAVPVAPSSGIDGRFHYVAPQGSTPSWVSFIGTILDNPIDGISPSSASGLLLLRTSGRIFALTFGYGRSLLDLSKIEPQFGLRVALNRIDPRQIRSLDTKTFEDIVVTTNKQVSRSAELASFEVDTFTDILRTVTGEPRDQSFAKRLYGSDALVLNIEVEALALGALCDDLLNAFAADDYKASFSWIDQLKLVRDIEIMDRLDCALLRQLTGGPLGSTHLAMPEAISWEDIDAFRITGTRDLEYEDLDLEDYLTFLGDKRQSLTLDLLKSRGVSVRYGRSGSFDKRWSVYQCIVSEQRLDGALYVLIEGRWFVISDSLVDEVDEFVSQLPESAVAFLSSYPGESEGDYNRRLAQADPDHLLLLDTKIKKAKNASSGIEFCDVMSTTGELVHVKRKSRSSTLSHLFAQGNVSAATFIGDGYFRNEIRQLVTSKVSSEQQTDWLNLVPEDVDRVDRSRYCITFAVITSSNAAGRDWLPFFSKLNLMQQGRQLRTMGLELAISRVAIEANDA
jgi:uncharacterized protein (TIGR04141 family)